jgi:hypothetical protein
MQRQTPGTVGCVRSECVYCVCDHLVCERVQSCAPNLLCLKLIAMLRTLTINSESCAPEQVVKGNGMSLKHRVANLQF